MADLTIVADDTHPVIVVEHLIEDWDLNLPNICISVVGTTGRPVNMLPRYLMRLKQGLLRAVCSTSCWILTGGTNQGCRLYTNICCQFRRVGTEMLKYFRNPIKIEKLSTFFGTIITLSKMFGLKTFNLLSFD